MIANFVLFFDWIANVDMIPSNILAPSKLLIKFLLHTFNVCPIKFEVVVLPFVPVTKTISS